MLPFGTLILLIIDQNSPTRFQANPKMSFFLKIHPKN